MELHAQRGFVRLAVATTIATYGLILVGALVRAAGAGLGCPDWPHCFGQWIPPTDAAQLPPEFDPSQFNALLTWTEYLNRLLGVTVGLLIVSTTVVAFRRFPRPSPVPRFTLAAMLLVGFQGWLGGQVVRSGLEPWMITAHMLVALVIVSLLLFATHRAIRPPEAFAPLQARELRARNLSLVAILVVLIQVGIGTQVRAGIEHALVGMPDLARSQWLEQVGGLDHLHRGMASVTALIVIGLSVWIHRSHRDHPELVLWSRVSVALVAAQATVGAVLAYLGLPPYSQVLHVLLASLLIGALSLQVLSSRRLAH